MPIQAYLFVVVIASAIVGMWCTVRFERLTPSRLSSAIACFALAFVIPRFGEPLLQLWMNRFPAGIAILLGIFPVFVCAFAAVGLALRYLIGLMGHAVR